MAEDSAITSFGSAVNKATSLNTSVVGSAAKSVVSDAQSVLSNASSGVSNIASSIQSSIAGAIGGVKDSIAKAFDFGPSVSGYFSKKKDLVPYNADGPVQNVLHNYASYNYIITLSILSDESYNFPNNSYKNGNIGKIICKSGSGNPNNRVKIEDGMFEFFIDNLRLEGFMGFDQATGNTSAHSVSFTVFEPYSMGQFYEVLQVAAIESGHDSFVEAPLLLTIEFIGHLSADSLGVPANSLSIEKTTKHIPMRLHQIEMSVDHRGATYSVGGFPYNERAFSTTFAELKKDVSIKGSTVHEVLQTGPDSLQQVLNKHLASIAEKSNTDPDRILIYFPQDTATAPKVDSSSTDSATTSSDGNSSVINLLKVTQGTNGTLVQKESDINGVGLSTMGYDSLKSGISPFPKDNFAYDEEKKIFTRDKITVDPTNRVMSFSQGVDVVDIINQVILTSEYVRHALKRDQLSESGKITWWRVDPQVFNLPSEKNAKNKGLKRKLIVYRIIPYQIDASRLMPPNEKNAKSKVAASKVIKEYNYIYTSKNLDILRFDLKFSSSFYRSVNADRGSETESSVTDLQTGTSSGASEETREKISGKKPNPDLLSSAVVADQIGTSQFNSVGGSGIETPASIAARQAHDIFNQATDMVSVDLSIIGDPYYIGDSGLGNYSASSTTNENVNSDNSADYQNSEVLIKINFRSPVDIDVSSGSFKFSKSKLIKQFSGLYRVTTVESVFNGGKFEQHLAIIRVPAQVDEQDSTASGTTPQLFTDAEYVTPDMNKVQEDLVAGTTDKTMTSDADIAKNAADINKAGMI